MIWDWFTAVEKWRSSEPQTIRNSDTNRTVSVDVFVWWRKQLILSSKQVLSSNLWEISAGNTHINLKSDSAKKSQRSKQNPAEAGWWLTKGIINKIFYYWFINHYIGVTFCYSSLTMNLFWTSHCFSLTLLHTPNLLTGEIFFNFSRLAANFLEHSNITSLLFI